MAVPSSIYSSRINSCFIASLILMNSKYIQTSNFKLGHTQVEWTFQMPDIEIWQGLKFVFILAKLYCCNGLYLYFKNWSNINMTNITVCLHWRNISVGKYFQMFTLEKYVVRNKVQILVVKSSECFWKSILVQAKV